MRLMKLYSAALVAVSLTTLSPGADARLYKWTDEDGNVFYSDKIPPEQSDKRHQILDQRGIVRKNVRRAKTPEEIEQERREQRLQAERERAEREQAVRDQILLETFATERDLVMARDDRLQSVDSAISLASKTLQEVESRWSELDTQMRTLQSSKQPIPGNLAIDHRRLTDQLDSHRKVLASRREERDNIAGQFEADLLRFRELRALR